MNVITMIVFSLALNLDLSVASISLGARLRNNKGFLQLALIISFLQTFIPIVGFFIGNKISSLFGGFSEFIGSVILIAAGFLIIRENKEHHGRSRSAKNILLVYLGAGIEDLLAGFSLGTLGNAILGFLIIFFVSSFLLNLVGLKLGSMLKKRLRISADLFTGGILIILGILSLFGIF